MLEIPSAICVNCKCAMKPVKNDFTVEMMVDGKPYYKISADKWGCPVCFATIVIGFAGKPFAEHGQPEGYDKTPADLQATFR